MSNAVLKVDNLSIHFGAHKLINNLSFSIQSQSIYGFLGKNGAGKTTTMKAILGLVSPNNGSIYVCGEKVVYGQTPTNRYIGYLPDVPHYFDYMNPMEYLKLCGEIAGVQKDEIKARSQALLERVGIDNRKKSIGTYSRGMKQRLGIAQALLHQPKLLICDEPTSALDPIGRKEILDLLGSLKHETTVMFSTHILSDIERICDHIAILHKGEIKIEGAISDVQTRAPKQEGIQLTFHYEAEALQFINHLEAASLPFTKQHAMQSVIIYGPPALIYEQLLPFLLQTKLYPVSIENLSSSLEAIFMEVIEQ